MQPAARVEQNGDPAEDANGHVRGASTLGDPPRLFENIGTGHARKR